MVFQYPDEISDEAGVFGGGSSETEDDITEPSPLTMKERAAERGLIKFVLH